MSELQFIQSALEQTARRRRLARALHGGWIGLLVGSALWLLGIGIYKLAPVSIGWLAGAGMLALGCAFAGFIAGGWRKASLNETARWVDMRQNLKERLSTALEVSSQPSGSTWNGLVLADAAMSIRGLDPRRLVRFTLPMTARWALLLLCVGAGLGFVPEYRSPKFLQQQADAQHINETGRQLAELTRHELQRRPPALEVTRHSLEAVADLGDELARETLTRGEALRELASASDQLKELLRQLADNPALKKLEQAARTSGGRESQTATEVQREIDALQQQLGEQAGRPEVLEKLQHELMKAQQTAQALRNAAGGSQAAAQEQLSASLAALAQQAEQAGISLPQLDEALAALAANQIESVSQALEAALTDLERRRDLADKLQQLQAQKLGKDLAEQLQQGQVAAAVQSLKKLAEQLWSAGLSPEQLQRIREQVADAVAPAEEYGRLAEWLQQAGQQLQQRNPPMAAQSLTAAAKELEDLLQQLADAGALMTTLENLQAASHCIGTGQGWSLSQQPGTGGSSRSSAGFGAWADQHHAWSNPGSWAGSGGESSTAGTGIGSRDFSDGDPTLREPLTPARVKGQFSPGAPMPGITLKGVSLKGQSTVQYEEAVITAQADAQAALSQEKVPRAYQGAVRSYFDDLKK
ncbi:MAG: hypothetical protein KIS67_13940 [Verrucomicrobiae bacterium]|nr:hypothetical protein [Verrucomicrobiae bacterium]